MSRFNTATKTPTTRTYEGGKAFVPSPKKELFTLVVSDFLGGGLMYESDTERQNRAVSLVKKIAVKDPQWIAGLVKWLRNSAQMRSISILVAVESAVALAESDFSGRSIINNAMARADEPGEVLAYWKSTRPGKAFPAYVKRAVADGAVRLYNEYSVMKYDSNSREFRFGDVINITHPKPQSPSQEAVFKMALDRRYNVKTLTGSPVLSMQRNRDEFMSLSDEQKMEILNSEDGSRILKEAGLTWEVVLSTVSLKKNLLWESLIPTMGYMALLRNLRNFEDANISAKSWKIVTDRLADKEEVRRSRQLPFRFLSAYRQISPGHLELKLALEKAVSHSLDNIPPLKGNSLIMFDLSGSMFYSTMSSMSTVNLASVATLFSYAMAKKADKATLVAFGSNSEEHEVPRSFEGVLEKSVYINSMGGTNLINAIDEHCQEDTFDRVIIVTDEQHSSYGRMPTRIIKDRTYIWNLAGYTPTIDDEKNHRVHRLGGLSAESFSTIAYLEMAEKEHYPWEK